MARARNIKPGFFKNEILGVADPLYSLLFEGLWLLADREGRLEDRPLRIKAEVFPYRDKIDIPSMLNWLQAEGFIVRYVVKGVSVIEILNFAKHQNPHKNEPESLLPSPGEADPPSEEIGSTSEKIGTTRADSLIPDSGYRIPDPERRERAKPARFDASTVDLPEWLPADRWQAWVRHRAAIKKPLTEDAARLTIDRLMKWRGEGHDPTDVINRAIEGGWQGIHKLDDQGKGGKNGRSTNQHTGFRSVDYDEGAEKFKRRPAWPAAAPDG